MIRSFADPETELVWRYRRSRKLPPDIQRPALRKLLQLDAAAELQEMRVPPGNRLEQLKGYEPLRYSIRVNDQWRITFTGLTEAWTMSGLKTTTRGDDRLDNIHPGEILREDFMIGSEVPLMEVSSGTGIAGDVLEKLLDGGLAVDANLDLRLGRYFGMSEGFFLRLQNSYDLEEERRSHGDELARIARRAA